jgi:hypothetical protein
VLQRKYLLVKRDHISRGITIVSYHWFKWAAAAKAHKLSSREARAHAAQASRFIDSRSPRFTWEVDHRCA